MANPDLPHLSSECFIFLYCTLPLCRVILAGLGAVRERGLTPLESEEGLACWVQEQHNGPMTDR